MLEEKPVKKISFRFSKDSYDYMKKLGESVNSPSATATVKMGLRSLGWIAQQKKDRRKILVEDTDGTLREVEFPFY